MSNLNIAIVTDIPSPYQVELFDELNKKFGGRISVIYFRIIAESRYWVTPVISHNHCIIEGGGGGQAEAWVRSHGLVVFSGYRHPVVRDLIRIRQNSGRPWAFWGERPGFHFPGLAGRLYRRWAQAELYRSRAPIWGIGQWAVDGYRSELGGDRAFFNVPYFSNLEPFFRIPRDQGPGNCRRFLFSGQFIKRKGIDLVVSSFENLLNEGISAELHLVGGGPLEKKLTRIVSGFKDKVHFHGRKQWHQLAEIYAHADILCAPSRYDGWGMIVPEALAAGMPVISSDRTGAARELIDPSNGWLVRANDADELCAAMKAAAVLSTDHWKAMSESARRAAARQHVKAGATRFWQAAEATIESWQK